jgi:hypothetical protein
VLFSFREV